MLNNTVETYNSIAYAMAEQLYGYDTELVSMAEETFRDMLKDCLILDDPEYTFEDQKDMIAEALDMAADSFERDGNDNAWESANSDRRVIYTYEAIEFYKDNLSRVENAMESIGLDGYTSLANAICAGVASVIVDDICDEINCIADDMRDINVEDII